MTERTFARTLLAALVAAALTACSGGSEQDLLQAAEANIAKGDRKAAAIELKNILQKNPQSGPARLMFGQLLLNSAQAVPAEVELRKALELKQPKEVVVPLLVRALVDQGKYKAVVDEFSAVTLADARATADLRANIALAQLRTGARAQAQQTVDGILKTLPDHTGALLVQARLFAGRGETDDALRRVRAVIAQQPKNLEAMQLEGDLLQFGKKDFPGAVAVYQKVLEVRADYLPAHSSMIGAYLTQQDLEGATRQSQALSKLLPNTPRAKYFEGLIAFAKNDFKTARENFQLLLRAAPDDQRLLPLAGATELQLNALVQAETYLSKAVSLAPEAALPRRLLAATYLRAGQSTKALQALRPLLEDPTPEPEPLSLAAEAYLLAGDAARSEAYFARAAKLNPKDSRIRTAMALTALAKGNADAAFNELESITTSNPDTLADLALISARIRRAEYDGALKAIAGLERKQPDKALAPNLRGRVLLARNDTAGARQAFEAALAKEPGFYAAAAGLAGMDLKDNQPEQARKRFEGVLKVDPKNLQALMALADLKVQQGSSKDEVTQLITAAVTANPTDAAPRVMLVEHLLTHRDAKGALAAAQAGAAVVNNSPEMLEAVGRAQLASGEPNQAIGTFNKLTALQPGSAQPYVRMAEAYALANDPNTAISNLKRALAVTPDLLAAQRALIRLYMQTKQPQQALAVARSIQTQRPTLALGWVFEGDIEGEQRNLDAAIKAYRTGLGKPEPGTSASRLHAVLLTARKTDEAEREAAVWLKGHPKDLEFMLYLGDIALTQGRLPEAEKLYQDALKVEPKTPRALNNLAWILAKGNKPGAVAMAEQAVSMVPRNPAVMDTLTFALAQDKQAGKALENAKRVVAMAPDAPGYRLTLARMYIDNGNKAQAKNELDTLAALGTKFAGQAEVQQLLKSL